MKPKSGRLSVFFLSASKEVTVESSWTPAVDVYRTSYGWLLKYELAGVRLEDIRVQRWCSRITVHGVRRDWTAQEVQGHVSMEIAYNRFERSVEIPCEMGECKMSVEYIDGLLLIRFSR